MKKYVIILNLILWVQTIWAQDPLFSNPNGIKTLLNPAWITDFGASLQVAAQYRKQAETPLNTGLYETTGATVQWNHPSKYVNYWGLGLQLSRDNVESGFFSQTQAYLSGYYSRFLFKTDGGKTLRRYYLIGAFSAGVSQQRLSDKLRWVQGYNPNNGQYQESLLGGMHPVPTIDNYQHIQPTVNVGAMFQALNGEGNGYELGISAFHLNRPNQSWFANDQALLNSRWAVHGSASIPIFRSWQPKLSMVYVMQGISKQVQASIRLPLSATHQGLSLELAQRWHSATAKTGIVGIHFRQPTLEFLVSYEMNLDGFKPINAFNNALEAGLIFKLKK